MILPTSSPSWIPHGPSSLFPGTSSSSAIIRSSALVSSRPWTRPRIERLHATVMKLPKILFSKLLVGLADVPGTVPGQPGDRLDLRRSWFWGCSGCRGLTSSALGPFSLAVSVGEEFATWPGARLITRSTWKSGDEMQDLAEAFNDMTAQIEHDLYRPRATGR